MKLSTEVLASASIKRKKPWPRIVWVGEEYESLLLLDEETNRISVLYVPSGKTKRKITKLSPLIPFTVVLNITKNGHYLIGLQNNGELYVWYKDKDVLKTICGLEGIITVEDLKKEKVSLHASNDCHHIILTIGTDQVYVWVMQSGQSFIHSNSPQVKGRWNRVNVPTDIHIPKSSECKELSFDTVFFSHQSLGHCCQCSFIYNNESDVCIVTLLLRFSRADANQDGSPSFHVEWNIISYPFKHIHTGFQPVFSRGAFVAKYIHSGQIVAVATNQNRPAVTSILFVSPLTDTVLVTNLKGCGVRDKKSNRGRNYWVADMAWTSDDLFLACIMKSGSVCIVTRLGEPLIIHTQGQGLNLGPSYFLPLHPLQIISAGENGKVFSVDGRPVSPSSETSQADKMKQCFSVSTHPGLPIVLFSDGFMVTVMQVYADITCLNLMKEFILLSSKHLHRIMEQENLDHSVITAYHLPSHGSKGNRPPVMGRRNFRFEEPDSILNGTLDSETSLLEPDQPDFDALSHGKILFAECDEAVVDLDNVTGLTRMEAMARHLEVAESALFNCWKLAVSYTELWNSDTDKTAKSITHNFIKVFSVILDVPNIEKILLKRKMKESTAQNTRLFVIVSMFKKIMELLRFDIINQHLMSVALKFMNDTLELILNSKELWSTDPRIKTLSGCYALLKFTESILNRVYVWVAKDNSHTGLPLGPQQKHSYEPAIMMRAHLSPRSVAREIIYKDPRALGLDEQAQLPGKRLCGSWKLLYKSLLQYQSELQRVIANDKDKEQLQSLIFAVEQIIHQIDGSVPEMPHSKLSKGEKYSLGGMHTMAVDAWRNQLRNMSDPEDAEKVGKVLHSVLYTYIKKEELGKAVDFVDSLVVQGNTCDSILDHNLPSSGPGVEKPPLMTIVYNTMKAQQPGEVHHVPCIRDRGVRQLVQSMARFMAAYFTNETMYIFPPHSPQSLPSVHIGAKIKDSRIIPQYHGAINKLIAKEGLSKIWTTERTLEYLLLSGLVCEAAWFSHKMGDWKVGFLLSVACCTHRNIAPHVYKKKKKPLQLPAPLMPNAILQQKLESLIHLNKRGEKANQSEQKQDFIPISDETNIVQLSKTIEDIVLAGIVGDVEIVPWLLSLLVQQLMDTVSQLSPLVPQDFYLPSPPLYCPQPTETKQEKSSEVERETRLRFQASSIIQLILIVLNSSHISLPVTRWYIQELANIQERAAQFKSTTEGPCLELPEILQQFRLTESSLRDFQGTDSVKQIILSFRDFCTVLWLLHSRDKLSYNLRGREKHLSDVNYQDYMRDSWESKEGEEWKKECFTTLQWAVNMLNFSKFLPDEGCIHKVILSLLLEFPPSEDTADILAEHFYDPENLDVEVQEKLEKFLLDWQSVFIEPEDDGKSAKAEQEQEDEMDGRKSVTFFQASPRGKTLSVYFSKQCEVVLKVLKKKRKVFGAYEEYVFDESSRFPAGSLTSSLPAEALEFCIGSRPFETKLSYLEFLDTFCAISFIKVLDVEDSGTIKPLPLLLPYAENICKQEFEDLEKMNNRPSNKKTNLVTMSSPGRMSQNQNDPPLESPRQSKAKLTNLASKFSQSEVLYRGADMNEEGMGLFNVDFGSKYQLLHQCLDWLSMWCKKQHSLGLHWKGELELEFRPTMKIDVSPRLVVLALWLLENKYSTAKKPPRDNSTERRSQNQAAQHKISLDSLVNQVNSQVTEAIQKRGRRPRRKLSRSERLERSWETDQDTSQVHTAYEEVLNGHEESSSIEVSSLEQDEYAKEFQPTLSLIRSSENMQSFKQRSGSLNAHRGMNNTARSASGRSPGRMSQDARRSPNNTSRSQNRSRSRYENENTRHRSRSEEPEIIQSHHQANQQGHYRNNQNNHSQNQGVPSSLAGEIQSIIRGELRRMMEAQHKSMMAMMGALDEPSHVAGSPQRYPSHTDPLLDQTRSTMMLEELDSTEIQRRSRQSAVRRRDRSAEMHESDVHRRRSRSRDSMREGGRQEDQYREGYEDENPQMIPRYLKVKAERDVDDFKLPPIPMPAWIEEQRAPEPQQQIQLLHLERGGAPSHVFPGLHRHPDRHVPQVVHHVSAPPPPSYQESFSMPQVPVPTQDDHTGNEPQSSSLGMPLLRLIPDDKPFLSPQNESSFGRLLDPSLIISHEQQLNQQDLLKHKHAREFFRQQVENIEELEEKERGSQLLQVNLKTQKLKEQEMEATVRRRRKPKKPEPVREEPSEKVSSESQETSPKQILSEKEEEVEEGSTEPQETEEEEGIHDGYAIKPGSFENYLHMNEKDFEEDTNARVQYRTAMLMKKQLAKEKRKKVDFSTMTKNYEDAQIETGASLEMDSLRTAEAATSITKDKGVDPIQEALLEYNRSRQGRALPPDIYLGLRFADADGEPTDEPTEKSKGRSYINVVDLDASAVLHDLDKLPEKEDKMKDDLGFAPQSVTMATAQGRDLGELEESMRDALRPSVPVVERPFKQDSVTVKMFESYAPGQERLSIAVMPRESVQGSRGAIVERLRDMNQQMSAIDHMATNIERDFHSTKLMLNTLDTLGSIEDTTRQPRVTDSLEDSGKKSIHTPKSSRRSPTLSARTGRTTGRTTGRSQKTTSSRNEKQKSGELVKMSGLSGISDIIGEMVEKGDIDLEEAGFTENEALKLAHRIKTSARSANEESPERERIQRSLEFLERMSKEPETEEEEEIRREEKAQLRAWMIEKRNERMAEYKKYRAELREHEKRPFKADLSSKFKETFKMNERDKGVTGQTDMKQRIKDAHKLLGDILTDKPELPPDLPAREKSPKRKKSRSPPRDRSPKTKMAYPAKRDESPKSRTFYPGTPAKSVKQPSIQYKYQTREVSPKRQTVRISSEVERKEYLEYHEPREREQKHMPVKRDSEQVKSPLVPKLKLMDSDDFLQKTGETTGEMSAYRRAVEDMESTQEITVRDKQTDKKAEPFREYKQKSFKDLVRLQRPEVTRKAPASRIPVPDVSMWDDKTTEREESARSEPASEKHLKVPEPKKKLRSPRRVMTYAERLQEMKSNQPKYSTPIVPRTVAPPVKTQTVSRKVKGPAHKPRTYVQQLQQLSKRTHHAPSTAGRTVKGRTFMRSHGPVHKPKPYVQQLKDLQPEPKVLQRAKPAARGHGRTRPYADPYKELWERDSVLSNWSVEDNVKRLLYEDDDGSMMYGKSSYAGMSADFTISEGISDYYDDVMDDEYIGSVDIDEIFQIADAASVRSGSVMSVIDWDAVDDLIADVH